MVLSSLAMIPRGSAESIFKESIIIKSTIVNRIVVEYIVCRFSQIQNYQQWILFANMSNIFR